MGFTPDGWPDQRKNGQDGKPTYSDTTSSGSKNAEDGGGKQVVYNYSVMLCLFSYSTPCRMHIVSSCLSIN
jgi:hypothetical protein